MFKRKAATHKGGLPPNPNRKRATYALAGGIAILLIIIVTNAASGGGAITGTYWQAKTVIPANTPLTPELVEQVTVDAAAVPPTAVLPPTDGSTLYAAVNLQPGDILTAATVTNQDDFAYTIPDGMVAVSLSVAPENAVAGKIQAGDRIDIATVSAMTAAPVSPDSTDTTTPPQVSTRVAAIALRDIPVVDVSVDPSAINDPQSRSGYAQDGEVAVIGGDTGPNSYASRSGIPQLYTLAVTPEQFGILALIRNDDPYIALAGSGALDRIVIGDASIYQPPVTRVRTNRDDTTTAVPTPIPTPAASPIPGR